MIVCKRFIGKTALVTGAGHGIGRAIAEKFSEEGARVFVNDINSDRAAEVAEIIGGDSVVADVSSKTQVDAMFDFVGHIDILVNNAGNIYTERHFLNGNESWWDEIIKVNLKGAFLCSLCAAQSMTRRGSGVIINVSSGGATKAHRGNVAYDASKGGIEAMTRAMALDLAPYGIRVNTIVPGFIRTYELSDEAAVERGNVVPLGRMGTAEDVAGPTVFLASEDARYITGISLVIDGGVLVQQRSLPVDTFTISRFPKL